MYRVLNYGFRFGLEKWASLVLYIEYSTFKLRNDK